MKKLKTLFHNRRYYYQLIFDTFVLGFTTVVMFYYLIEAIKYGESDILVYVLFAVCLFCILFYIFAVRSDYREAKKKSRSAEELDRLHSLSEEDLEKEIADILSEIAWRETEVDERSKVCRQIEEALEQHNKQIRAILRAKRREIDKLEHEAANLRGSDDIKVRKRLIRRLRFLHRRRAPYHT